MKHPQNYRNQRGFTLVELAVYGGLLAIFLLVLTQIFSSVLDVQLESEATSAVAQDGRYILLRLSYDVGRATAITIPATLGSQTNTLQLTIGGIPFTYATNSGNLVLTNALGSTSLNSPGTSISNVSFRRLGNPEGDNTVRMNYTVTSVVTRPQGVETQDFQTTLGLR